MDQPTAAGRRYDFPVTRSLMLGVAALGLALSSLPAWAQSGIVVTNCYVTLIEDVEVAAEAQGALMTVATREGIDVKAGDPLGTIDDREARTNYELAQIEVQGAQAEASNDVRVRYATAQYEVAVAEYDAARDANQRQPGAISKSELRRLLLQVKQANLGIEQSRVEQKLLTYKVKSSEARVQAAQVEIDHRQITAPLDGVVVEVRRHAGEWVNPGDPVIRIIRINRLRVEGFLNNNEYARDRVEGRDVLATIDLGQGRVRKFRGKVTFVSTVIQAGGDYRVRAEIENVQEDGHWLLQPGQRAQLEIIN